VRLALSPNFHRRAEDAAGLQVHPGGMHTSAERHSSDETTRGGDAVVTVRRLVRRCGRREAVRGIDLVVRPSEIWPVVRAR
jgi:hypothetical protein